MGKATYQVIWSDQLPRVILIYFFEGLTWQDYDQAVDDVVLMLDAVQERSDIIVAPEVPMPEGNPFPHLQRSIRRITVNSYVDMIIRVGDMKARMRKEIGDIVANALRLDPRKQIIAETLEEALALIERDRSKDSMV